MKNFFSYTAILEAITGLGLIFIPAFVIRLLLLTEINSTLETLVAMVGGSAISTVALVSWMARKQPAPSLPLKALLFYNAGVTLILAYGNLGLGLGGIVLWGVIVFHLVQSVITLNYMQKKRSTVG